MTVYTYDVEKSGRLRYDLHKGLWILYWDSSVRREEIELYNIMKDSWEKIVEEQDMARKYLKAASWYD